VQDGQKRRTAVAALAVLALAGCNGGTVDRHALKRDAEKIGSLATEGGLLAADVSKGASTRHFVQVHANELSSAAADFATGLATRPTVPGIEPKVRRLAKLAKKVAAELERLHGHPTDRAVAESLRKPLRADADAAATFAK
jgi:hypothetical protein